MRVILASASPRRRDLLTMIGIAHVVIPADVDETYGPEEVPRAHAERLAREKASVLAARAPDAVIIAADTIVVVDGDVLGKPRDADEAARDGHGGEDGVRTPREAAEHARGAKILSGVEEVGVTFRPLDDATITSYVATGEPMDKAGAYGIQGYGAVFIESISGSHSGVMGLPLFETAELLREAGIPYWNGTARGGVGT